MLTSSVSVFIMATASDPEVLRSRVSNAPTL